MKRVFYLLLFSALFMTGTGRAQPPDRSDNYPSGPSIDVSYFYENLSSDGKWFPDPTYGWCWTPYDVSEDWRPYSLGHWEYSDLGWSWASDESFGWATYHYGRWFFDNSYGWAWVPGTEWAPAWVAWRAGDDWMGWAPLPPTARWDDTSGLAYGDADAIPSDDWCFVPRQHVFDLSLTLQLTSVARNVTLLERSHDATRYEVREGRPANVGFDIAQFEITFGRRVPRVRVADVAAPTHGGGRSNGSGQIDYYRPRVALVPAPNSPGPMTAGHGNGVPDAEIQRQKEVRGAKLEADLSAERSRLARDQQNELSRQAPGVAADETRKRHASEQQAFDAHAAQQRQVLDQRMQRQVVRPDNSRNQGKPAPNDKGNNGKGRGNGKDKGNNGNNKDKGN